MNKKNYFEEVKFSSNGIFLAKIIKAELISLSCSKLPVLMIDVIKNVEFASSQSVHFAVRKREMNQIFKFFSISELSELIEKNVLVKCTSRTGSIQFIKKPGHYDRWWKLY